MLFSLALLSLGSLLSCKTQAPVAENRPFTLIYESKVGGEFEPCG